jgi:signal transduction histidine kinase
MRRRSRAGDESLKKPRRKTVKLKRRNAPKVSRRRSSSTAGQESEVARLTSELHEALAQQTATSEVLRVISSSPGDLQRVFESMLANAARICDAKFGNVFRLDGDALVLVASHNTPPALIEARRRVGLSPKLPFGRMATTKAVIHVTDLAEEEAYIKERDPRLVDPVEIGGVRTILAVPMLKENELIGAFSFYRQEVRPFTDKQIALVMSFANQAVIAIENTRLLNELRQRTDDLDRSVSELRVLGEVSQAVNSILDLETVLSTIVSKAVQLSGTDAGAIYVFDDTQREFQLRATYCMDQELIDAFTHRHIGLDEPNVALALTQDQPFQATDLLEVAATPLNRSILSAGYRALLVAPLLHGEEVAGILVIHRRKPGRFSQNSVDLMKTFAGQSTLAIKNAGLFENVETRTRELAHSLEMLQRERNNKLMTLEAMAASIAHEVRQPLAAIATNAIAALRFVRRSPPDLEEVQSALNRMVSGSHRASDVLESIRTLFKHADLETHAVDLNDIARTALQALSEELKNHGITTRTELASELPLVPGHSGQLQEVILNLVQNAIDAMDSVSSQTRVLRVSTESHGSEAIAVSVQDSGPGIDPEKISSIFDAFVTTKSHGMGLGLAICQMIVGRHEGQLSASPAEPCGSVFRVILPVGKPCVT